MLIAVPRETEAGETRAALVPETAARLIQLGVEVAVQNHVGEKAGYADEAYEGRGARIRSDRRSLLSQADAVIRLNKPPFDEVDLLKPGSLHISFLDPFRETALVEKLASRNVQAVCMELIPRTTRAQKMDALSSQASLAGYTAVIAAAERLPQIFPLMMTPAGTLSPARVFVIGAGVAGLQAIATAKRLGARVEAFDTRPAAAEQVESLGARFVRLQLGETGEAAGGYAKALTEAQLEKQRELTARHCASADVVITTAQVFGREAPLIVTREMIAAMRAGSVVVDLAIETGGNVEGAEPDREVAIGGVRVLGYTRMAARVPHHASQMYSSNVGALIEEYWEPESRSIVIDPEDEILRECLLTRDGEIRHPKVRESCGL